MFLRSFGYLLPVLRVLIDKGHKGYGFAAYRHDRFVFDRPFLTAVTFTLCEALPYKVARSQGYGKREVMII